QDLVSAFALGALELQVPVADQVQVADLRGCRLIQRYRAIDVEVHPYPRAAVDQVHGVDLADLHPGGPDELACPQPADVAEFRRVAIGPVEPELTENNEDHDSKKQQHQGEDAESDDGAGDFHGLIVLSPT